MAATIKERGRKATATDIVFENATTRISYDMVTQAIIGSDGMMTRAASILGISAYHFKQILSKQKALQREFEEFKEEKKDLAEEALFRRIAAGDTTAIIFCLKCIAKDRGYVERTDERAVRAPVKMKISPATKEAKLGKKGESAFSRIAESVPGSESSEGTHSIH